MDGLESNEVRKTKITCDCGNESTFKIKSKESRQFYSSSETVLVGSLDTFSVSLANPATMEMEIGCKLCGTYYRISLFNRDIDKQEKED